MIQALTTAATGLEAQQANIQRISNDLANVNTDAYKSSTTEFKDLMYVTTKEAGGSLGAQSQSPVGVQTGLGVKVGATYKKFEQGPARMTYHPYDIMIDGKGFFPVQLQNGEVGYTRNGAFHLDAQGRMQLSDGSLLIPNIVVPANTIGVTVTANGEIRAQLAGQAEAVLGQVQLVSFANDAGLNATGNGIYKPTLASGAPQQGIPGENGVGVLQQGALEGSNVNVANSMIEMISSQRAYEMGTKTMGVVDQMWGTTANIIK